MSSIPNSSRKLIDFVDRLAAGWNSARASYEIWFTLVGKDEAWQEFNRDMNDQRYVNFFDATIEGHCKLMFIELACLFEDEQRAVSFPCLRNMLIEHNKHGLAETIESELKPYQKLIRNIRTIRNKSAAHHDINWTREGLYDQYEIIPNVVGDLLSCSRSLAKTIYFDLTCSDGMYPLARIGLFQESTYSLLHAIRIGRS